MKKTILVLALIACSFAWLVCFVTGVTLLIAYGVFDKQLVAHPEVIGPAAGVGTLFIGMFVVFLFCETSFEFGL